MTIQEIHNSWVITVLGRNDVERTLGPVTNILKEHGLELDRIESPYKTFKEVEANGYACVRFYAYGRVSDESLIRSEFLAVADEIAADIVWQAESEFTRERRLFIFDMDSTLIQGETIDELAKMADVADRVIAITASAMRGEIEFPESFQRRVALLAGLPEAKALEVVGRIPLMEGAERLFRVLKARGCKTAILSGGFTFLGAVLQEKLGADYLFANELDLADGFVTGEVQGRIVDGARKAELLVEIAGREGIPLEQVVAVGDGANDLPMLSLAGMGVAFHAKPVVRASAKYAMTHVGLDGLLEVVRICRARNGSV
jgi:phosphoserine phosphatase